MKQKPIDRFTLRYTGLKAYVWICHWLFYRRIQTMYRSRIPKDRPVLLAPNHQLALMDAMAPLMTSRRDPVFLARADVFNNKFIAGVLRILKILPVYRIRDGAGELSKNEDIFNEALQVLGNRKCPVCIMPEGNHGDKRHLRPLVKGIFRIALRAQEAFDTRPGVVIVPVGIDYSRYTRFRGKLYVHYGKPIEVCEYYAAYLENQPRAINGIRERLSAEMRKGMIDIRSEDHYGMYMQLRETYNDRMRARLGFRAKDLHHRFLADKHMIRELEAAEQEQPEKIDELSGMCRQYREGFTELGLRDWVFKRSRYPVAALLPAGLGMLVLAPLFLYGAVTNLFPYWLPARVSRKVKDPQFHTSFRFVTGVFLFPVWYLVLFIPVWILTDPGWVKWAFLGSLPLTGLFAHAYLIRYKKLKSLVKYQAMTMRKNRKLDDLKKLRKSILERTGELVSV